MVLFGAEMNAEFFNDRSFVVRYSVLAYMALLSLPVASLSTSASCFGRQIVVKS